jgi:hypothetical protein
MELPKILQGESLTRLIQGAAAGAIVTVVVGFNWAGWMLGSTAQTQIKNAERASVVRVLAPICADKFTRSVDASANLKRSTSRIHGRAMKSSQRRGGRRSPAPNPTAGLRTPARRSSPR